jgi:hypothetical protein
MGTPFVVLPPCKRQHRCHVNVSDQKENDYGKRERPLIPQEASKTSTLTFQDLSIAISEMGQTYSNVVLNTMSNNDWKCCVADRTKEFACVSTVGI